MALKGLGSVSGAGWTMGAERFPGWNCGNPGWHRGNPRGPERNPGWHRGILWGLNGIQGGTGVFLAEKFESPTTMCREPGSPHRPKASWACPKPIGKDGLPCPNLYICNQGRNQSRKSVAIACFAMDYKSLSRLGLGWICCPV